MTFLLSRLKIKIAPGVSKNTSQNMLPTGQEENTARKFLNILLLLVKEESKMNNKEIKEKYTVLDILSKL